MTFTAPRKPRGPNKHNLAIKDCVRRAFHEAGGKDYLVRVAKSDPKTFLGLLGKLIPAELQVTGSVLIDVGRAMLDAEARSGRLLEQRGDEHLTLTDVTPPVSGAAAPTVEAVRAPVGPVKIGRPVGAYAVVDTVAAPTEPVRVRSEVAAAEPAPVEPEPEPAPVELAASELAASELAASEPEPAPEPVEVEAGRSGVKGLRTGGVVGGGGRIRRRRR